MMTPQGPFFTFICLLVAGLTVWAIRIWLKQAIEQSVRHFSETKLEQLRAELRSSEEKLKSDLRAKEAEIQLIRSSVMSGRSEIVAIIAKKRVEAVEKIWACTGELAKLQMPSMMLAILRIENISKQFNKNVQFGDFLKTIAPDNMVTKFGAIKADEVRPFISEFSWSLYSAYQAIIGAGYAQLKVLSFGLDDSEELVDTNKIKDLLKTVLPHQAEWLDQHGSHVAYHLLDEIRGKLLYELKQELDSPASDQKNVERSAKIMAQVSEIARQANPTNLRTV